MPISGLTDTSNKDDPTATAEDSKVADHATIKVKVDSGSQSWCIVTIDGNQDFAGIIDGGETKNWDVTGSFEFQTANSSPIKLTVDDKEQTLTADTSTGYYTFKKAPHQVPQRQLLQTLQQKLAHPKKAIYIIK